MPPTVAIPPLKPIRHQPPKAAAAERSQDSKELWLSFAEFIGLVNPKYKWSIMSERLVALLQRVADGELKRLMVFIPPRHGKSELISRLFSAYYLYRHPDKWVGINSYAADLAYTLSRAARSNFRDAGGQISEESSAVKHWETTQKGGCWAAGVGGPITGKGFSLGIIDDPLKNFEEAASEAIRSKQKDWYDSTFYTRAEEDAAIVVLQTRWHEDDLSGWLLSKEKEDEPERWHIVSMEAIKQEQPPDFPPSCTLEQDWRQAGEPLNPSRFSLNRLLKISKRIGGYFWGALYQQRPVPLEGGMIKAQWVQRYRTPPHRFELVVLSLDTANKKGESNCPWSGLTFGIDGNDAYLLHAYTERHDYPDGKRAVSNLILRFDPGAVLIEDKSSGITLIQEFKADGVKDEAGASRPVSVVAIQPEGDKITRMMVETPAIEAGRLWLPESASWLPDFESVIFSYPKSTIADPVDALSQFLRWWKEWAAWRVPYEPLMVVEEPPEVMPHSGRMPF